MYFDTALFLSGRPACWGDMAGIRFYEYCPIYLVRAGNAGRLCGGLCGWAVTFPATL